MLKYIIYYFGLELPENVTPLVELAFNFGMICLVVLLCFINVFGYLIALYFIQNKNLVLRLNKYPKFNGIINYFKKSSFVMVIIEGLIGFSALIVLIYLGFSPLSAIK